MMMTGRSLRGCRAMKRSARRVGLITKIASCRLVLAMAVLAIGFSGAGRAADMGGPRWGGLQGKMGYCSDCHGASGQGYRGFFTMPRLAGQTPEYLENQLRAFVEGTRVSHNGMIMSRVHGVGPGMQSALAQQFADLSPRPFGRAPRELVAEGQQIYEEGAPDANVPACSVCHGPEARGHGPIPRLAGQLYGYTIKELANWSRERGQNAGTTGNPTVMQRVAHSLSKSQMAAVAAYLSYLD
jgi:cytochrome c553